MLYIRDLKQIDENVYEFEYQPEGCGEWGMATLNFNTKILEIIVLAKNDYEDSMFYKGHIVSAIKTALKNGKTETCIMWY